MPLSVVLQGIDRTRRLDQAFPSKTVLERLLPFGDTSFPMLGFIDPYGNTLFSSVQMQLFIPERIVSCRTSATKMMRRSC
jgi:hypothetical protein